MRYLPILIISAFAGSLVAYAQSNLLDSVKRNPNEAIALCNKFRDYNTKGISASSKEVIEEISKQQNLSAMDSEILSMYVIGLHCPEVI